MPAPLISPKFRAFDANGDPLASGKLYTYLAGTTTNTSTYPTAADAVALTNANDNPVTLDANGEADVWLTNLSYKFVLKDSAGVTQWTVDNVNQTGIGAYSTDLVVWSGSTAVNIPSNSTTKLTGVTASASDVWLAEWDGTAGEFTAAYTGTYIVRFGGQLNQAGANVTISNAFTVSAYKNASLSTALASISWPFATGAASNKFMLASGDVVLSLTAGDVVDFRITTPTYTTATMTVDYFGISIRRVY